MAAAAVSKRQQARNERELHELLQLPDNAVCADCGTRNPGWASWNLGVFLCMRCASIHRKLGTHISKVKSLTMDTWNADQVEKMKRTGNAAANKIYNPKNKRPDIPLDVDQVDSAMERFIRKKYQEKSLADGRPEPPTRNKVSPPVPSKSPEGSPPPPVPSKKGRFFGFGLRASSSAYPESKHDKKKLPPEPRIDSAWTIDSDGLGRGSRMDDAHAPMSDAELQRKLQQLADMGFTETVRNTKMLKGLNGDVERTVEALVQLRPSPGQRPSSKRVASAGPGISIVNAAATDTAAPAHLSERSSTVINNPFDKPPNSQTIGLSVAPPPQQPQATGASYGSNNPFDQPPQNQTVPDLSQALEGMQISPSVGRPLFPHSTGGYPMQQQQGPSPRFQTMTPPVPSFSHQQHGYFSSPAPVETNPFFQSAPQPQPQVQAQAQVQATNNNPFFTQVQQPPAQQTMTAAPANPFMHTFSPPSQVLQQQQQQQQHQHQQHLALGPNFNHFGTPSTGQPPAQVSQNQPAVQAIQPGYQSLSHPPVLNSTNPFEQQTHLSDAVYGQAFQQPLQQQQQQQQPFSQFQTPPTSSSALPQPPPQFQQFAQPSTLAPQQTGRYDKQSILALYNHPQLAPARPQGLSSIPEPASTKEAGPEIFQPKRSITMPISMSHMHSAAGSAAVIRNPFLQSKIAATPQPQQGGPTPGIGTRHTSQESVSINNLESGRHSPDAFANLSARYVG